MHPGRERTIRNGLEGCQRPGPQRETAAWLRRERACTMVAASDGPQRSAAGSLVGRRGGVADGVEARGDGVRDGLRGGAG